MAFCEVSQDQSAGTPAAAGDFGFKVLTASDPAEKTKKLNAELANGRLAMMAIIGMFFQALQMVQSVWMDKVAGGLLNAVGALFTTFVLMSQWCILFMILLPGMKTLN